MCILKHYHLIILKYHSLIYRSLIFFLNHHCTPDIACVLSIIQVLELGRAVSSPICEVEMMMPTSQSLEDQVRHCLDGT